VISFDPMAARSASASRMRPLFDREGGCEYCRIGTDITRFREAEELKSTFISIISHELKTPVALIKGTQERCAARCRVGYGHRPESAAVIEEEADRLTQLINNLLDASRLQAGGLSLNLSDVALDRSHSGSCASSARKPTSTR